MSSERAEFLMKTTILTLCFTACLAVALAKADVAVAAANADQTAAKADATVDPRLDGWLGCWRLEDDLAGTGARLCVTPEKDGVRLQTLAGEVQAGGEVIIPDGVARPISDAECRGSERSAAIATVARPIASN